MKCFIAVISAMAAVASAQYVPLETSDVAAAKQAHFAAHAQALARNGHGQAPVYQQQQYAAVAAPVYQQQYQQQQYAAPVYQSYGLEDGQTYPVAEPYIHEEYAAEPYIHQEIAAEPYIHIEPAQNAEYASVSAPIQQAAYATGPAQNYQPTQNSYQTYTGCYNYEGASVECRY